MLDGVCCYNIQGATDADLDAALEMGRAAKEKYYSDRGNGISIAHQAALGLVILTTGRKYEWDEADLCALLALAQRREGVSVNQALRTLVAKRMLSEKEGSLRVPTTSMAEWLEGRLLQYLRISPWRARRLADKVPAVLGPVELPKLLGPGRDDKGVER